jgi:hypothetical protein
LAIRSACTSWIAISAKIAQWLILAGIFAVLAPGCRNDNGGNKPPSLQAQTPDKILLDRGVQSFADEKYSVAITLLQTLINTYPESPHIARARSLMDECSRIQLCAPALDTSTHGGLTFFPSLVPEEPSTKHHGQQKPRKRPSHLRQSSNTAEK